MATFSRRHLLLIERLDMFSLPVVVWHAWRFGGGFYVGWARTLQPGGARHLIERVTGLKQLKYEDFPGSYFEAHEQAITTNDTFYDDNRRREADPVISFLRRFRNHELIEVALRRAVLDTYTLGRVKALVLLRGLAATCEHVTFVPRDNRDPRAWCGSTLQEAWDIVQVPAAVRLLNMVKARFEAPAALCFAVFLAGLLVWHRGLALAVPRPKSYRVGYDVDDQAIQWAPYYRTFLYDDNDLAPQKILHVAQRGSAQLRRHFEKENIPFVEAERIPVPLGYLMRRIIGEFLGGAGRLAFSQIATGRGGPFSWAAVRVVQHLIKAELLDHAYRTDVFIWRVENGFPHILRTLLHDDRGGMTIGFSTFDETYFDVISSYFCSHIYCFWGEFQRDFLKNNARYCRNTCVTGAGIYGLDETFRRIQAGAFPERYAHLKGRSRIVGVFTSSFKEDFLLSREMALSFYRTALKILERYPDVVVLLKPKGAELNDSKFRNLLEAAGPRVILDEDGWTYDLIPVFDLVLCLGTCSVGLESLMAGRKVIYLDETGLRDHPYEQYDPCLVARSPEGLLSRIDQVLGTGKYVNEETLAYIRRHHGLRFDGKVTDRFRDVVYEAMAKTENSANAFMQAN
jgi:hypothetical protein